ncbi:RDD family protein [Kocuria coralli]|uniref:RDD family protein n=1 Tax=Kocuria coralli TaxID=1461025 RepID=A0A5J5KX84_9MICC|nr:RDD family protein [Kocuria coralli]KAA9393436.1 RDD family protein [Kocuria coralli]
MINRDDAASTRGGPSPGQSYPGKRLGRPETGPGSLAGLGVRVLALLIDWFVAMGLAALLFSQTAQNVGTLGLWLVITALSVGFTGHTIGHFILGMQVQTTDGYAPGFFRGVIRSVLVFLIVPGLIMDQDQRGLQDRAVGTLLVKIR